MAPTNPRDLLFVTFRMQTERDDRASKEAGRPIYKEFEVCEIRFPGDRLKTCVFPAHEADPNATRLAGRPGYEQFAQGEIVTYAMVYNQQYQAFKNKEAQPLSGTPLSELPFLTQSKRLELKALNIHTAESLAALDGQPLKQLGMGGRALKDQARAYLDKAAGTADVTRLAADNAALQAQMAEMQKQMAELIEAGKAKIAQRPVEEAVATVNANSPFASWDDPDIKAWIKDQTGAMPRGNPNHSTLVASADEINAALQAKAKEAA